MAEHLTRNEKVVGSIPTISSKKSWISTDIQDFLHFYCAFVFPGMSGGLSFPAFPRLTASGKTHTVTHTPKETESTGEKEFALSPVPFSVLT